MIFWLGTCQTDWLGRTDVPLFISRHRLAMRKRLPKALGKWALDSGGFSELSLRHTWTVSPQTYADEVRLWHDKIGNLQWAAIQDWMCEPVIRENTGLTTLEHQKRTIDSYHTLRHLAPDMPWTPVLQGWLREDYVRHVEMYLDSGVELSTLPLVGLGSVCRRQGTHMAEELIRHLSGKGIRLHGFGFKTKGLLQVADVISSSDSMAWSFAARRGKPMQGCQHRKCNNCIRFALRWRDRLLDQLKRVENKPKQLWMFA